MCVACVVWASGDGGVGECGVWVRVVVALWLMASMVPRGAVPCHAVDASGSLGSLLASLPVPAPFPLTLPHGLWSGQACIGDRVRVRNPHLQFAFTFFQLTSFLLSVLHSHVSYSRITVQHRRLHAAAHFSLSVFHVFSMVGNGASCRNVTDQTYLGMCSVFIRICFISNE